MNYLNVCNETYIVKPNNPSDILSINGKIIVLPNSTTNKLKIQSCGGLVLVYPGNNIIVEALSNSIIVSYGDCFIFANDNSKVFAYHNTYIVAKGASNVIAKDNCHILCTGLSKTQAHNNVKVWIGYRPKVSVYDNCYLFKSHRRTKINDYRITKRKLSTSDDMFIFNAVLGTDVVFEKSYIVHLDSKQLFIIPESKINEELDYHTRFYNISKERITYILNLLQKFINIKIQ